MTQPLVPKTIVSKVDLNLVNPSLTAAQRPRRTGTSRRPWAGHSIQVAPVVANGTLYLFGTGEYRMSSIYASRRASRCPREEPSGLETTVAPYLADTAGLQVWTGSAWVSSSSSAPAQAGALVFPDDSVADAGEISVQVLRGIRASG